MKTTLMFGRMIANPRRTTLAHLKDLKDVTGLDATEVREVGEPEAAQERELPQRTANPRRTVLTELPQAPVAP